MLGQFVNGRREDIVIASKVIALVKELAEKYNVKPVNIALRYLINKGVVPIVGIKRPSHVEDLVLTFEFDLSPTEMDKIHVTLDKVKFAKLTVVPYMIKRLVTP